MNTRRILITRIAAAAALIFTPSLHAAERFWIDPLGGSFADIANWSATDGGAGGATVPGVADVANFTLNNTYTVTFGAATTINALDAENGNVTLDLGGFTCTLASTNASFIGQVAGQTGRLTVKDGTLTVDTTGDNVLIGHTAGSTGFLTVTTGGILGTAGFAPDVIVGDEGTGTLTVNDNGQVNGAVLTVGNSTGVAGTATITGPNAGAGFGNTTIGASGTGTLSVLSGGTLLTSGSSAVLGNNLGSDGTATVSGIGSLWTINANATIGNSGDGSLTISSGGRVTSGSPVTTTLGNAATGVGTATVTGAGSLWNITGTHTIGASGLGVMTVSSGGEVVSTSSASLGSIIGSEGRATVTGAGSRWAMTGGLTVGSAGTGDLMVSAGGEISTGSMTLGFGANGIGEATITGAGSKLTTTGALTVASNGSGTLNVAGGAEVYVGTNLAVNDPAAAPIGTLNLDGGSIYVAGNFTNNGIFNFTDGLLRVAGNFQLGAAAAQLILNGSDLGGLPTLDLVGTGTTTNVTGITVGSSRRGELRLRQGRVVDTGNNQVAIASFAGSEGTLSVESGAQLLIPTAVIQVGGAGGNAGGTGTLNISSGGLVDAFQVNLFRDGTIHLNGGTLALNSTPVLEGTMNWTGGTLRFDAAISLTSTNVPKFLGLDATLGAGQVLASTAAVTLQTPLTVDGGALNASSLINQSLLEIRSGTIGNVQNSGTLLGNGVISGAVTNTATGRIRADAGKSLTFTGTFGANAGQITLAGGALDFTNAITNNATGFISGRGALNTGGLTNSGVMAFSGGNTDIYGDVTNAAGARIVTSGAGSTTTFFDDLAHNGTEIFTGANASTVIFGASTGAGPFTGTGTVYSIGDLRPGNSPATVSYGGSLVLGNGTLTMEIGGLTEGTQYDSLHIASSFYADGTLSLSLFGGYSPVFGDTFDLFDYASVAGAFDALSLPSLAPNLTWDTSALYSSGTVSVISTLPPIQQWRLDFFGSPANAGNGANLVDFDGDGIRNLAEYGLGTDPLVPTSAGLPTVSLITVGPNQHAAITFTRPLSATDVNYIVEVSSDLATWLPGSSYSAGGDVPSNANTTQVSRTNDGTLETLVVRANAAVSAGSGRFLRVRVTHPTE